MKSIVLKFGGSSQCLVGYNIIKKQIEVLEKYYDKIIIVVSAIKGVTDKLIKCSENKKDEHIDELIKIHKL